MNKIKFGSVCSGIEAASVAWHHLGWEAAWLSEIEPFPSAVLAHHYPDVPNLGDMTQLPDRIASGEVEAPDVFCGGTPCQAFSVAGLRRSLDDARGNLSLTFCDIANEIDAARTVRGRQPAIIFWENVPGVLNTADNAFGCFLAGLAGEDEPLQPAGGRWANAGAVFGPSRAVAWRVLDAQYFGVAQRRRRVFVVASARDDFDPASVLFEFDGLRRDIAPSRQTGKVAPTIPSRSTAGGGLGTDFDLDGGVITMAHGQGGAEIGFDRGPCLTCNHEAPIAAYSTKLHNTASNQAGKVYEEYATSLDANSPPPAVFAPVLPHDHVCVCGHEFFGAIDAACPKCGGCNGVIHGEAREVFQPVTQFGETAGTLTARHDSSPCADRGMNVVAQPIAFSSKDHGADATADLSPTLRAMNHADSHANGGGQMAVAQPIGFTRCDYGNDAVIDGTPTMRCGSNYSAHLAAAMPSMQVRRLTPVECERLQGFPDNYTAIPWRKKPASECPDGPRYKALGNSWAVPVVSWIGKRIQSQLL